MLEAIAAPLAFVVGALGAAQLASRACGADERDLPIGARLLAGIALFSALAGWLVAAGAYSRGAALVLLGLIALGLAVPRQGAPLALAPARRSLASALWLLPIAAFVCVRGLGALRFPHYNPCDDLPQYLHFPRLMLETGAFEEPFSTRRLGVLGAGPLVQGFFWPAADVSVNAAADAFLGLPALIGSAGLVSGTLSRGPRSPHAALAFVLLALLATLSVPYINTLPTLLPYAGALALFGLHARLALREPDAASTRDALLFGALAAFLIGLRVSNAVVPAVLWACALGRALARRDRSRLRQAALVAVATAGALAPWCLSLWRSSGTPLFPLFAGNYRFDTMFNEPLSFGQTASFVAECAWTARIPVLVGVAALACAVRAQRALALEIAGSALALLLATALTTTAFDAWTVLRYCAPFSVPALFALGALVAFTPAAESPRWRRPVLALLAAAWLIVPVDTQRFYEVERSSPLGSAMEDAHEWDRAIRALVRDGFTIESLQGADEYRSAQRALPPEARVISASELPWQWRYDAQVIHSLDFPGPVSPPPGMPFFAGPEALADYFRALGYTHLALTRPRRSLCLYSIEFANSNLHKGDWLWRTWAPYSLDFLQNELALARSRELAFHGPTLLVADLRRRVEPAAAP